MHASGRVTAAIARPDADCGRRAGERQRKLLKPAGALGRLEELACWWAARQRRDVPRRVRPAITVFAADHGVARRNVSAYPASVTREMLRAIAQGGAAISVLAREVGASLTIVDVGVDVATDVGLGGVGDIEADSATNTAVGADPAVDCGAHTARLRPPRTHCERIAQGTRDLSVDAAMSIAQARRALDIGAHYARVAIDAGHDLLIAGEIGIGNTTAASCLIAATLEAEPDAVVGTGTGIDATRRARKLAIVRQALARHGRDRRPLPLLASLGGYEIAAMTGYYLEAARAGVPCMLDGFISAAAALVGCTLDPALRDWLIAAHLSAERGHAAALEQLGLRPLLECDLRLGEGTGAALAVPLIQAAIRIHAEMASFEEAGVSTRTDAC